MPVPMSDERRAIPPAPVHIVIARLRFQAAVVAIMARGLDDGRTARIGVMLVNLLGPFAERTAESDHRAR